MTTPQPEKEPHCPHCLEFLGARVIHICPVACCYVGLGGDSLMVVCPYCGNTFDTAEGHVCLELIRLSQPAQ
ncbi:MAG TPA: hypothetical protein VE136_16180 [Anaerolineales bacterium]|jgi:hypothetical protein|nr:hypothetical protein [Anaerolineales bacterium]